MRDFQSLNVANIPDRLDAVEAWLPTHRRDMGHLDYFLRDLSRGVHRITVGQVPDGSGTLIIDAAVSKKYWYKPGDSPFGTAFMDTGAGSGGTISSTSNGTKGMIDLGSSTGLRYDETNVRVGLSQAAPSARLHMVVPPITVQSARPATVNAGSSPNWGAVGAANVALATSDQSQSTWAQTFDNLNAAMILNLSAITDPGTDNGHVFKVTMYSTAVPITVGVELSIGGPTLASFSQAITTTPTQYPFALTSGQAANFAGGYGSIVATVATSPAGGGSGAGLAIVTEEVFEVPVVGGGSVETLQKWSTTAGAELDQLDFAADGGGGTDMVLSGDTPLMFIPGDGTSGLRTYNASSAQWLEVGKSDGTNMVLNLSGNRQTQMTSLRISAAGVRTQNATSVGAPSALQHWVNSGNAALPINRLVVHSSQSADAWQIRDATDASNLASFDSTGKLIATTGIRNPHNTEWPASNITISSNPTALALGNTTFIRFDATGGARQVRGFGGGTDGRYFLGVYLGTPGDLQFNNQDGSATAANRLLVPNGTHFVPATNSSFMFVYDDTTDRWRLFNWLQGHVNETISGAWTFYGATQTFDFQTSGHIEIITSQGVNATGLHFTDADTAQTATITWAPTSISSSFRIPESSVAGDFLVAAEHTQRLKNKTLGDTNVLECGTVTVGVKFQDATTATKQLNLVVSGLVGNSSLALSSTASRAWEHDSDFACRLVTSGKAATAAGGAGTAGVLGKHDSTGNTGSIAATTLGNTLPAGKYRVTWYARITTAGDAVGTDNLTVTVAWNDGGARTCTGAAQNNLGAVLSPAFAVDTLNRTYHGLPVICDAAAATNITIATTLVNAGATNPAYDFSARIEAL